MRGYALKEAVCFLEMQFEGETGLPCLGAALWEEKRFFSRGAFSNGGSVWWVVWDRGLGSGRRGSLQKMNTLARTSKKAKKHP